MLRQFRSYAALNFKPGEGITMLLGDNAQGKTNLLEAVALLSTGRSHRTRQDRDLVKWGSGEAILCAETRHEHARHEVLMRLSSGAKRQVEVNGALIRRTGEMLGYVIAVLFAPEDLGLIKNGPQERRRFMDMELSQAVPGYYYALQRYNRALRQRNALLRVIAAQPGHRGQLDIWDGQLCIAAPEICLRRREFAERLAIIAGDRHRDLTGAREELAVEYRSGCDAGEKICEESMREALFIVREGDIRRGMTSVGPHRDDLVIRIQGRDSRLYASQGQQRTAALALKLSELQLLREQTGECPVLLLDDVMSELDPQRQGALLEHMTGVQTLITAAVDIALPSGTRAYRVCEGKLIEV